MPSPPLVSSALAPRSLPRPGSRYGLPLRLSLRFARARHRHLPVLAIPVVYFPSGERPLSFSQQPTFPTSTQCFIDQVIGNSTSDRASGSISLSSRVPPPLLSLASPSRAFLHRSLAFMPTHITADGHLRPYCRQSHLWRIREPGGKAWLQARLPLRVPPFMVPFGFQVVFLGVRVDRVGVVDLSSHFRFWTLCDVKYQLVDRRGRWRTR
ncbi:hypothetical protein F5148DRAFT_1226816 [Russula earlei]|uniref:Uncharacterized protein n=1 Tax=Russula earlei TaxID=71964 RepID=A0ACC0TZT4_9AGAM|nr:hypothetical protein F5148DRAFT_1226816 [Russula earlei]